ncbi:HEPN domain-containing protein [Paenibacillus sp. 1-18]|uniref:HEPN domain-containing protein n=1 Tax=Paenibacillus sp. 1-18 TaxID=1333846 RepID=UPI0004706CCB|nr:HEPN domain-containing protein [Paenibacillus sp. 1-18]
MKNYSLSPRLHSDPDFTFPTYGDSNILNCIMDFQKLAQYQIQLAQMMRNHNQFDNCLVLCDRAMFSMAKAIYVHRNQVIPSSFNLSISNLLRLIHMDAESSLDIVLFMSTVHYLISRDDGASKRTVKPEEVDRLLNRTDHILKRLSRRMVANPTEQYNSEKGDIGYSLKTL